MSNYQGQNYGLSSNMINNTGETYYGFGDSNGNNNYRLNNEKIRDPNMISFNELEEYTSTNGIPEQVSTTKRYRNIKDVMRDKILYDISVEISLQQELSEKADVLENEQKNIFPQQNSTDKRDKLSSINKEIYKIDKLYDISSQKLNRLQQKLNRLEQQTQSRGGMKKTKSRKNKKTKNNKMKTKSKKMKSKKNKTKLKHIL